MLLEVGLEMGRISSFQSVHQFLISSSQSIAIRTKAIEYVTFHRYLALIQTT